MAQKNNLTIRALSIIGGTLTAIFFFGFLVQASLLQTEASRLLIGSLLILITLSLNRIITASFLDAMNITLYIAGCSLTTYGLSNNTDILFIILAGISIVTFWISRGFILPFLSVILFIISFFGEVLHLSSSLQLVQLAIIPIIAVFLLANLFETKILTYLGEKSVTKYKPFHSGLFVSCLFLIAGLSINLWISNPYWILSIFIWIGLLITIQQIMVTMEVTRIANQAGVLFLCIIICLPTLFAPYLSGSLLLILICFQYGYKKECAAALLVFIYAISKYYYDLNISLLLKSATLFFIGIAFLLAWYYFTQKRTKHEEI